MYKSSKKVAKTLTSTLSALLALNGCVCVARQANAATWYVNAAASSGGNGTTLSTAFQTIQAAANVAAAGDVVLIKGGTYRETVKPVNSGTSTKPITYEPYSSSDIVVVSGADNITSNLTWQPVSGQNYYSASFTTDTTYTTTNNQAEQLFVNGQALNEARYPHLPYMGLTPLQQQNSAALFWDNPGTLTTADNLPYLTSPSYPSYAPSTAQIVYPGWKQLTDTCASLANITGNINGAIMVVRPTQGLNSPSWGFTNTGYVVSHAAGSTSIVFDMNDQGYSGLEANYPNTPFYLIANPAQPSNLALLGAPGEWFHDKTNNVLYLYDPKGGSPSANGDTIEIKRRDYAFDLSGVNNSGLSYITLLNIRIFAATITTDTQAGDGGTASGLAGNSSSFTTVGRGDTHTNLIYPAPSNHIILDGITAKYVNHFYDDMGWPGSQWTQNSGIVLSGSYQTIQNSVVDASDGNGILCLGKNNLVKNNVILNTNCFGANAAAITTGAAEYNYDCRITGNTISSTGFDGIHANHLYSSNATSPAEVDHNRVTDFGVLCHDVGGIKLEPTNTESFNGTRWDHNLISDGDWLSNALYWDTVNGTPQLVADHNIAWNTQAGLNLNANSNCSLFDNTLSGYCASLEANGTITSDNIENNIFMPGGTTSITLSGGTVSNNVNGATSSMFVNSQIGNMQLLPSATNAIDQGIALASAYTPDGGVQGSAWDVGAYEYNNTPWWLSGVGSSVNYQEAAPTNLTATLNGNSSVTLTWTDNATTEANYYVERAIVSTVSGNRGFQVVAQLPANTTTWTDNSTYPGYLSQNLRYRVRTENSTVSNTVSAPYIVQDTYSDNVNGWFYGGSWASYYDQNVLGSTAFGGANGGGYGVITVYGTSVAVYCEKAPTFGSVGIQLDGVTQGNFSENSASPTYHVLLWQATGLQDGPHKLFLYSIDSSFEMVDYVAVNGPVTVPTFTATGSGIPSGIAVGGALNISANFTCSSGTLANGILGLRMLSSTGQDQTQLNEPTQYGVNLSSGQSQGLTWSCSAPAAGTYSVYAFVWSSNFSTTLSYTLLGTITTVAGSLTGSAANASGTVNLSSQGTSDWSQCGYSSASTWNHKSSGGSQINSTLPSGFARYTNNGVGWTWTGGTPTASVTSSTTGVSVTNGAFSVTVPASITSHTLKIYVGGSNSTGTLTASLSDGSAPNYTSSASSAGNYYKVYTLTFNAGSANQTLTVNWTQTSEVGKVTLQAATLQ
jgi:hypothetical protein